MPRTFASARVRLVLVAVGMAGLIAILSLSLLSTISGFSSASDWARHSDLVIAQTSTIEHQMLDLQIGLRGYAPTGERRFLRSYDRARSAVPRSIAELQRLVADNPQQVARARTLQASLGRYLVEYPPRALALGRNGATREQLTALYTVGQARMDAMRGQLERFIATERQLSTARLRQAASSGSRAQQHAVLALLGTLTLLALLVIYVLRSVLSPVRRAAGAARTLHHGDLGVRLAERDSSEVGDLATAFNQMAAQLQSDQEQLAAQNEVLVAQRGELQQALATAERANRATAVSEARLAYLFNTASDLIHMADEAGRLLYTNPAWRETLGYDEPGVRLLHVDEVFRGDRLAGVVDARRRSLETGEPVAHQTVLVTRDGREIDVEGHISVGQLADGTRVKYGVFRDETVRRRIERERDALLAQERETNERLRQVDRLKDELVMVVSHELRTPLTSIQGYLDLVLDEQRVDPAARRFLETAQRNADRLRRLVEDLLTLSRLDGAKLSLTMRPLDLAALTAGEIAASGVLAESKGVALDVVLAPAGTVDVQADEVRLGQVVDNLVANAVKFTPEGGRVRVEVSSGGGSVRLVVSDTGIGIPADEQGQLFERFFRASTATERQIPGTGLGLAIAKAIVDAHGGTIEVESATGRGTTFRVTLPAAGAVASAA